MTDVTKRTPDPLIAADRVTGTAVYNRAGEKLGTVDNIMIDKASGKAVYGIMSFGGFLGIGENQFPLPWSQWAPTWQPTVPSESIAPANSSCRVASTYTHTSTRR